MRDQLQLETFRLEKKKNQRCLGRKFDKSSEGENVLSRVKTHPTWDTFDDSTKILSFNTINSPTEVGTFCGIHLSHSCLSRKMNRRVKEKRERGGSHVFIVIFT